MLAPTLLNLRFYPLFHLEDFFLPRLSVRSTSSALSAAGEPAAIAIALERAAATSQPVDGDL
jgi:hypothetical protein